MEPDNLNSNIQFLTCNTLITSYIVRSKSTHFWGLVWTSFPIHFAHTARQRARQKYTALHENNDIIFHVKASKYQGFDAQVCAQYLTAMKQNMSSFVTNQLSIFLFN